MELSGRDGTSTVVSAGTRPGDNPSVFGATTGGVVRHSLSESEEGWEGCVVVVVAFG